METVVPRAVPQGPTVSAPPPTAQVSAPPPDLQRLEIGAKLDALVLQATSKGVAEVSSTFGKLQIVTTFPLPANAKLQLQVIGKFPLLQLLITTVQGKSPQALLRGASAANASGLQSSTPHTATATTTQQGALARATSASVSLTTGANVVATKIGTAPLANLTASPTSLAPGALSPSPNTASPTTTPLAASSSSTLASPGNLSGQTAPGATAPASQATTAQQAKNTLLNQVGSLFSVRISNVVPPALLSNGGGLPTTGNATLAVGQTVTGVVTATTAQGQAVVQTHAGPIALSTPSPLPPGTTISFVINEPLTKPPSTSNSLAGRNAEVILETHKWPQLDDALRTLTDSHPTLGQQVVNSIMPKADATLAANILLLLSAIRGGDIRSWMGDAPVRALQRIRPDLMARLRDDFGQLSRLADDSVSSDWRSFPVPFLNGSDIEQIRLFIKRKSDEEADDEEADQGTRFIIDLDLSLMGRLQLDGLVKSHKKQFDLIVRSDNPLPAPVQNQIRSIFQTAMDQLGNNGGLTFQAAPANFLNIQSNAPQPADSGLIV